MGRRAARKIGFIGAGNMASALLKGILEAELVRPADVWVADTAAKQRRSAKRRHGVAATADNRELVRGSRIVVLAVKPQILQEVLEEVNPEVTTSHLFVSIAAGFPLARLESGLGARARVVRAMPNTPALLGKGMSVLVKGARATAADLRAALEIFRAAGQAIAVADERLLDPVTGLSGSGPAYVFRFAEALIEAGVREGLAADVASQLVFQTLAGASAMLQQTEIGPRGLREMVSSPGGTTLAGLAVLEKSRFFEAVVDAVAAATARSKELSGVPGRSS
ncbi:MAG: pyrroline-5-carboxylate reductase [Candidatus Binatia bacterium]